MGRIEDVADETVEAIAEQARDSGLAPTFVVARTVWLLSRTNLSSHKWRDDVNDAYMALMSPVRRELVAGTFDHVGMPSLDIDDATHALVRFAAEIAQITEAEVIARAIHQFSARAAGPAVPDDPWIPIEIHAVYDGQRIDGLYLPATKRVTVTSGPIQGQAFKSPSGAARAVVTALNPGRANTQTNGWRFWHINATNDRLETLRAG